MHCVNRDAAVRGYFSAVSRLHRCACGNRHGPTGAFVSPEVCLYNYSSRQNTSAILPVDLSLSLSLSLARSLSSLPLSLAQPVFDSLATAIPQTA